MSRTFDTAVMALFRSAVANPCTSVPVLLLADRLEEIGLGQTARLLRLRGLYLRIRYGGGKDDDGGDGSDGGYGDNDGDGGVGYGGGYGGGGGSDGDADGGGSGGGGSLNAILRCHAEGPVVDDGFYILAIPAGHYPFVLAGWVDRRDLFLRVRNSRVLRRYGSRAQLSVLADNGPQPDTQLLDLSPVEWVPVSSVARAIPADPAAWADHCPDPDAGPARPAKARRG